MASRRAVIVLTESQSLTALWRAALSSADQPAQDVVVVFLDDERWQRAACLPFTCEISRIGGGIAEFTIQRAAQIGQAAVAEARRHTKRLAEAENIASAFEVLTPSNHERLVDLVGADSVLFLPSLLSDSPVYRRLERLGCRVLTVDDGRRSSTDVASARDKGEH